MRRPSIGVIGPRDDRGLELLEAWLVEREATVRRIDLRGSSGEGRFAVDRRGIRADGVRLDKLSAIYVGSSELMSPIPDWAQLLQDPQRTAESVGQVIRRHQESRSLRASALELLSDRCPLVNRPSVHRAFRLTPLWLRQFAARGLPVPAFVSGNDLEKIAYFVDEHAEQCRLRRLQDPTWSEVHVDFELLKAHHLDFDRFPVLVRRWMGGGSLHAVVVGRTCAGFVRRAENTWQARRNGPGEAAALANRASAAVGVHFAVVHLEEDERGQAWIVGVDPEPDLAALAGVGELAVVDHLGALLLELASGEINSDAASMERDLRSSRARQPREAGVRRLSRPRRRKTRVGLVGEIGDAEVIALGRALEDRGAEPVPLEFPLFPDRRALHECAASGRFGAEEFASLDAIFLRRTFRALPLGGDGRPFQSAEAWWHRRVPDGQGPNDEAECFAFKYAVLEILGHRIPVINPPSAQEVHRIKVSQLFSLMRAGLPVPPTVSGNDPEACRRFVEEQGGEHQVVLKPLAGIYKTRLLSEVGLDEALAAGPVLLQRYVRGETIRAYLVAGELHGAGRILRRGSAVDSSVEQIGVEPVELPQHAASAGWTAAERLGLSWTGMDFIRDADTGSYFILELNAAAMFAGFAQQTGCDIPGAIARLLLDVARRDLSA